jgi:16S rRNA A1518/A1519 N6-dimethyltransferase RsmA/KsgA/DIM1 with predicted DNA glycosylase/AP lyase activity
MSVRSPRVQDTWNYLHDRNLVRRLVDLAGIDSDDVVIEIGPGHGIITEALAERAHHVIAIEKHEGTTRWLQDHLRNRPNVTVFASDVLAFPMPATPYTVFASIPAAIVGKLTTGTAPPRSSHLVMQREAAERLIGTPRTTLVAATLHPRFDIGIVHVFRRHDFRPAPAVDCVLVRIAAREAPLVDAAMFDVYGDVLATCFSAWKPSVGAALAAVLPAPVMTSLQQQCGEVLDRKPGDITPAAWIGLFRSMVALDRGGLFRRMAGAAARLKAQQQGLAKETRSRTSDRRRL